MPWKLRPGTPSIFAGKMMPCQWIEASSSSVFETRSVTVSPSFHRNVGAGTEPLTVNATFGEPVTFIGVSPMRRSKSAPASVVHAFLGSPCAKFGVSQVPRLIAALLTARPLTKVRRDAKAGVRRVVAVFITVSALYVQCLAAT